MYINYFRKKYRVKIYTETQPYNWHLFLLLNYFFLCEKVFFFCTQWKFNRYKKINTIAIIEVKAVIMASLYLQRSRGVHNLLALLFWRYILLHKRKLTKVHECICMVVFVHVLFSFCISKTMHNILYDRSLPKRFES